MADPFAGKSQGLDWPASLFVPVTKADSDLAGGTCRALLVGTAGTANLQDADGIAPGATVALTGKYVAPKRIVDDPEYITYAPGMVDFLLDLPWCTLEVETIFAPPPVE